MIKTATSVLYDEFKKRLEGCVSTGISKLVISIIVNANYVHRSSAHFFVSKASFGEFFRQEIYNCRKRSNTFSSHSIRKSLMLSLIKCYLYLYEFPMCCLF